MLAGSTGTLQYLFVTYYLYSLLRGGNSDSCIRGCGSAPLDMHYLGIVQGYLCTYP